MKLPLLLTTLFLIFFDASKANQVKPVEVLPTMQPVPIAEQEDPFVIILWMDKDLKLHLNEDYLKTITDQQRAALGFIATFVGNDCNWEDEKRGNEGNLKCILLTALQLGSQCSAQHLGFLRKWFREDQKRLEQLQYCTKKSSTEKIRDTFLKLGMITQGNTIKIHYTAMGMDQVQQKTWEWTEESVFQFGADSIKMTNRKNLQGRYY